VPELNVQSRNTLALVALKLWTVFLLCLSVFDLPTSAASYQFKDWYTLGCMSSGLCHRFFRLDYIMSSSTISRTCVTRASDPTAALWRRVLMAPSALVLSYISGPCPILSPARCESDLYSQYTFLLSFLISDDINLFVFWLSFFGDICSDRLPKENRQYLEDWYWGVS
jgi:hypothetical protein